MSAESTKVVSLSVNNMKGSTQVNSNSTSIDVTESACDNDSINERSYGHPTPRDARLNDDHVPISNGGVIREERFVPEKIRAENHGDVYLGSPRRILLEEQQMMMRIMMNGTHEEKPTISDSSPDKKKQNVLTKRHSNSSLASEIPEKRVSHAPQSVWSSNSTNTFSRNSEIPLRSSRQEERVLTSASDSPKSESTTRGISNRCNQQPLFVKNGRLSRLSFAASHSVDRDNIDTINGAGDAASSPSFSSSSLQILKAPKIRHPMKRHQLLFRQKSMDRLINSQNLIKNSLNSNGECSPVEQQRRQSRLVSSHAVDSSEENFDDPPENCRIFSSDEMRSRNHHNISIDGHILHSRHTDDPQGYYAVSRGAGGDQHFSCPTPKSSGLENSRFKYWTIQIANHSVFPIYSCIKRSLFKRTSNRHMMEWVVSTCLLRVPL